MRGWEKMWVMLVKNKNIWDIRLNSVDSKKNNEFVDMCLVKNHQTFTQSKNFILFFVYVKCI